jgi:multiple sugar transport system permease protein
MKKNWHGLLFLLPSMVGLLFMIYGPVAVVFGLGFTEYDVLRPPKWNGIQNYVYMFTDPLFWKVLFNTLYFTIVSAAAGIVISLVLALLVNLDIPLNGFFRTIFFIPVIVSMIAAAFIWKWMFYSTFGVFNYFLSVIGIKGPLWLDDPRWTMLAVIIMSLWKLVGYNMVIFLAGLKNIPKELYESAEIDGAGPVSSLFKITLPLLTPTTFFVIIVTLISSFRVFEQTYAMTSGGPANATLTFALHIFNNAFQFYHMGFASSLSFVFFLLVMIITVIQLNFQKKWVFYG